MSVKVLFLATEDWFVRSHFAPLVARAVADGFETVIAARMGSARAELEALGARTIDLPHARGELSALALARAVLDTRAMLAHERPTIVHAIALKPIMIAALAAGAAPGAVQVLALTGRGHLATSQAPHAGPIRWLARASIADRVRRHRALLVLENGEDRVWIEQGRALPDEAVTVLPGAGVDPDIFSPGPEPEGPIRIGLAARLVRSKGVDVAIEAFGAMRAACADAQLLIAGAADRDNPASYTEEELSRWRATPGVHMLGFVRDMGAFWRGVHIACLPSRGGEGLPRSLIEAGACARPIVTTDVPGCRDFVADCVNGMVVPPDQPVALATALARLALEPDRRRRMGEAGRARVMEAYTVRHVADLASAVWARAQTLR